MIESHWSSNLDAGAVNIFELGPDGVPGRRDVVVGIKTNLICSVTEYCITWFVGALDSKAFGKSNGCWFQGQCGAVGKYSISTSSQGCCEGEDKARCSEETVGEHGISREISAIYSFQELFVYTCCCFVCYCPPP